jgi:hypothetical protein
LSCLSVGGSNPEPEDDEVGEKRSQEGSSPKSYEELAPRGGEGLGIGVEGGGGRRHWSSTRWLVWGQLGGGVELIV